MGQDISIREARSLSRDLMSFGKVRLDWPDEAGGAEMLPKDVVKILCNVLVVASGALPRGGELKVTGDVSGGNWSFMALCENNNVDLVIQEMDENQVSLAVRSG